MRFERSDHGDIRMQWILFLSEFEEVLPSIDDMKLRLSRGFSKFNDITCMKESIVCTVSVLILYTVIMRLCCLAAFGAAVYVLAEYFHIDNNREQPGSTQAERYDHCKRIETIVHAELRDVKRS